MCCTVVIVPATVGFLKNYHSILHFGAVKCCCTRWCPPSYKLVYNPSNCRYITNKTHSYWSYKPCKYRNHSWNPKISVVRLPSPPRRRWPEAHRDVGTTDRGGAGTPASPLVNPHYPHGKCDFWVWFPGLWFRKSSFILKNRQLLSNSSTFNFQTHPI